MNASPEEGIRRMLAGHLPDWASARIERVTEGRHQDCYLLSLKKSQALLKVDQLPRDEFVTSREEEARIQTRAAEQRIAPGVLYADDGVIVTQYLSGAVLSVAALREPSVLKRLGALLRQVHSLPRASVDSDLVSAARHYAASISDADMTARCIDAVARAPASVAALCHNDVVAGNLLRADGLFLIDWEYARNHSPLFDLATVIAHHGLSTGEARILLDAYAPSGVPESELDQYQTAYHALHWLWLASRKPQDPELQRIAALI